MWRPDDEHLLERLLDERTLDALFAAYVGAGPGAYAHMHARAAGLVAELRKLPSGADVVRAALSGDVDPLARFVEGLGDLREPVPRDPRGLMTDEARSRPPLPPELLHHLALFHRRVALTLESAAPDAAANAWVRSLATWLALAEERTYIARLEEAVLGSETARGGRGPAISPDHGPLAQVEEIAERAKSSARDLLPPGRAALQALARIDDAAKRAGASEAATQRMRATAERLRNGAIEAALSVIAEALDDASARGELTASGPTLLLRAVPVWTWTANDVAVEHFVVDRLDTIGWELYRARRWDALRYLLEPFTPMFDQLAGRIERDPTQIAYAAGCAQMFVFRSETSRDASTKLALAERAVRICPTHRNGRLILAAVLCDQAVDTMRGFGVFARKRDVERVEELLGRAESIYPQSKELPEAKKMLAQVKRSKVAV